MFYMSRYFNTEFLDGKGNISFVYSGKANFSNSKRKFVFDEENVEEKLIRIMHIDNECDIDMFNAYKFPKFKEYNDGYSLYKSFSNALCKAYGIKNKKFYEVVVYRNNDDVIKVSLEKDDNFSIAYILAEIDRNSYVYRLDANHEKLNLHRFLFTAVCVYNNKDNKLDVINWLEEKKKEFS